MEPLRSGAGIEEIAAVVSQALEQAGITATLSGGAAVSIYSSNEYESADLDFITSARNKAIADAVEPLGTVTSRQSWGGGVSLTRVYPPGAAVDMRRSAWGLCGSRVSGLARRGHHRPMDMLAAPELRRFIERTLPLLEGMPVQTELRVVGKA